jgi:hypothetical protein
MEDWKTVGKEWRPAPFWSWNDKLQESELRRQIREMADRGWGGYFMHSRVGLVTGYLSDDWMDLVKACAQEARETDTWAWLYDEDKWPSGFAGGIIPLKDPSFRTRLLVLLQKEEITPDDTVLAETEWQGMEYAICRRVSPLGNLWFDGTCYVDLMNPDAVKAFIDSTHEVYKRAVGEFFGREIPGIFTDEPAYAFPVKIPFVPWSDCLPLYFHSLKGYDITDHLEQLFFDIGNYRQVRFDFYDTATRLFRDSFTRQYYQWCDDNGLIMTGHFMAEDNLASQTRWIGAAMPHYKYMHWPGIDKLGRHLEQVVTVKQVSSAVEQLGKERAICEVFGCIGQQSSFFERKWIADWEAVLGIGYVNHHLSLYSMRGERKRDYPANLFYQQPWWEDERGFADYIARLCKAATEGARDVDILIIHPISSFWSEYSPLHAQGGDPPEQIAYDRPFETLSRQFLERKLDYHYGDEILIEEEGSVKGGRFSIGRHSYSIVVVPPSLTLRESTWKLLNRFAETGGRLLFIQPTPTLSESARTVSSLPSSAKVVRSVEAAVSELDALCERRVRVRDLAANAEARSVYLCVRDVDSSRRILMANTDNSRECKAQVSIPLDVREGSRFENPAIVAIDLVDGSAHPVPFRLENGAAVVAMTLAPVGSILIILSEASDRDEPAIVAGDAPVQQSVRRRILGSGAILDTEVQNAAALDKGVQEVTLTDVSTFEVEVLDENVLPIERVTLWLDEKEVLTDAPIAHAWHKHFYAAEEGTPFVAEYSFEVRAVPSEGVTAVIEVAENLDEILCNGAKLVPLKGRPSAEAESLTPQSGAAASGASEPSSFQPGPFDPATDWKDVHFTRVPIPAAALRTGKNILTIKGRKSNNITSPNCHSRVESFREHTPTEVEVVYIVGDFVVGSFDSRSFHICDSAAPCEACAKRLVDPADLTASGYPFYAGRVHLSATMNIPDSGVNVADSGVNVADPGMNAADPDMNAADPDMNAADPDSVGQPGDEGTDTSDETHRRDSGDGAGTGSGTDRRRNQIFLSLGSVRAASVSVKVNGKPAKTLYWAPHSVDVTELVKQGENSIELVASTTLFNCFGPGWVAGIEDIMYVSPGTFVDMSRYTDRRKVLPFGVGEARLFAVE